MFDFKIAFYANFSIQEAVAQICATYWIMHGYSLLSN